MFKKLLIANRGEIACRVIRTARAMGIKTVAVYSDADQAALHVRMADEAVRLGPPPASESYLRADKIIQACLDTGAEAVHPGYGFLSENAGFAEALAAANITFIGPPTGAISAMGDKIESKKLAEQAGVSTVPGYPGEISDTEQAGRIAAEIGFPVMIKASAGGGGKGMRVAWNADEVAEGFARSKSEAASSFGDDRMFIEKFIEEPRHIEIQVLGDTHGNCIYLGERECSIQRRNQKVIEEAPSPFLDEATRAAMGAEAVALARAVDYHSAGTVEFIVDKDHNFYFLEMNTRLQVEHPVTELITGIDLVEQMIRVAAGEKLSFSQSDVRLDGWAIEARIYAEDPRRDFLPSTGRLVRYCPPVEGTVDGVSVRNDTGVYEGGEVSIYYDPMIAKLCTHAPDRAAAVSAMAEALDGFLIEGCGHNIAFLSTVMGMARFRKGDLSTRFIADEFPSGFTGAALDEETKTRLAALAVYLHTALEDRALTTGAAGLMAAVPENRDRVINFGPPGQISDEFFMTVWPSNGDLKMLSASGTRHAVRASWRPGDKVFRGDIDGHAVTAIITLLADGFAIAHRGARIVAAVRSPRQAELAGRMRFKEPPDTSKFLLCPMPGLVLSIDVAEGDKIEDGQTLAVVEAMKMENVLKADKAAIVKKLHAEVGASLAVDAIILEFE